MIFEADGQFYFALLSVASGFLCGLITFVFEYCSVIKNKIFKYAGAAIRGAIIACLFVFIKERYAFPDLKAYMLFAFFAGFFIYKKTLAKIIAIFWQKIYNIITIKISDWRQKFHDSREKRKNRSRVNGVDGFTSVYIDSGNDLSDDKHKPKKGKNRTTGKTNRAAYGRAKKSDRRYRYLGKQMENRGSGS